LQHVRRIADLSRRLPIVLVKEKEIQTDLRPLTDAEAMTLGPKDLKALLSVLGPPLKKE